MCSNITSEDACLEPGARPESGPVPLPDDSVARLRAAMGLLPVGVLVLEGQSCDTAAVSEANAAFAEILGFPVPKGGLRRDFPFRPYLPGSAEPIPLQDSPAIRALVQGETTRDCELRILRPDGEWRTVLMSAVPVGAGSGVTGAVVVIQDVTGLQRAAEALRQSEERFRVLAEGSPIHVWSCLPDGTLDYANARLCSYFGMALEELRAAGWEVKVHPEDLPMLRAAWAEAFRAGEPGDLEFRVLRPDGTYRWFWGRMAPLVDENGRPKRWVGASTDITARKQAVERSRLLAQAGEMLASSLDYRVMLDRLARLAVPLLADFCVVGVLGDDPKHGHVAVAHVDQEIEAQIRRMEPGHRIDIRGVQPYREVLATGRPLVANGVGTSQLEGLSLDPEQLAVMGRMRPTAFLFVPLVAHGRSLGLMTCSMASSGRSYSPEDVALAQDLAGRAALAVDSARLYEEAQLARADAEEANRAKDEFVALISHELRNPANTIQTGLFALRLRLPQEERLQRTLGTIEQSARLQMRLINDLLDLTRLKQGKLQLRQLPMALDQMAHDAVLLCEAEAEAAGLALVADTQPGLWVLGDCDRLQQVAVNLISNAIKFTPSPGEVRVGVWECEHPGDDGEWETKGRREAPGGEPDRSSVPTPPHPHAPQRWARVVVEDTGVGISPELLPRLFALFQQGDATGRGTAGLGIGLALVKSLTEMHGGRVWAESDGVGKGSRFIAELPLIAAPQP